ncbi:amidohydrolase family protein [Streptomyces sp. NPDC001889]
MLITAGRIHTGIADESLTDGAILLDGDTITAVGPRAEIEALAPAGGPRQDFSGATIVPGLIDAHVHLAFDGGPDPVATLQDQDDDALLTAMAARAEKLLHTGVTTARDLGDRNGLALRLADAIARGTSAGPRIISAGTPVTPPGGHCWFLGGEASGTEAVRAMVRRNAEAGARVIKIMETGGGLTKGGPQSHETQYSAEELAALVDEAHRAGLPVAAHAHGVDGITHAVEAGVDTIEHCTWMTATGGFDVRADVLEQIIAKGIRVCPAVSPHWPMLSRFFGEEKTAAMFGAVRQMAEAGVRLIAGTDAGVQRADFDGLPASLTFYEHLGVPKARILHMATVEAADALGLGDRAGRIAQGFSADLLVLDGDPLEDLGALRAVNTVFARGNRHQPAATA